MPQICTCVMPLESNIYIQQKVNRVTGNKVLEVLIIINTHHKR